MTILLLYAVTPRESRKDSEDYLVAANVPKPRFIPFLDKQEEEEVADPDGISLARDSLHFPYFRAVSFSVDLIAINMHK